MIPISGGYSLTRACRETTMHDFQGHACVAVWSVVMWEGCHGSLWKGAHSTWDQHAKHARISCFWVCPFMYHECSLIQAHMLPFMHGLVFMHVHAFCIHAVPHGHTCACLFHSWFSSPAWNVFLMEGNFCYPPVLGKRLVEIWEQGPVRVMKTLRTMHAWVHFLQDACITLLVTCNMPAWLFVHVGCTIMHGVPWPFDFCMHMFGVYCDMWLQDKTKNWWDKIGQGSFQWTSHVGRMCMGWCENGKHIFLFI